MSARTRFPFLIFSSLIVLSACGTGTPTAGNESDKLLTTDKAPMNLVEEEKELNPVQQHMNARKQVSPSSDSKKYTSKADGAPDEPVHFRVLKLERQMSDLRGDFGKLLRPLSKLPTGDNELNDTISQIELQQQQAASEHMAMYDQAAAPMPGHATVEEEVQSASLKTDEIPVGPVAVYPSKTDKPLAREEIPPPKSRAVTPPEKEAEAVPAEMKKVETVPEKADQKIDVGSGAAVSSVRVGDHPGKVRIVLDLTGPAKFAADVDNNEKILLVDLPGTGWTAETQKLIKNPLVKGYVAQKNATGNGTVLAIKLAKPAKVLMATVLPPNESYGNRIAIDVSGL